MIAALGLALLAAGPLLREERFRVERPSEVVVTLTLGCERCDWAQPGREAAALVLSVDGKYSQHLILSRGASPADYRVALGGLAAGRHELRIHLDRAASAKQVGRVAVERARFAFVPEDGREHAMLAYAPVLHARPDTLERFTDLPLLMWCERETIPGGYRLRYSVIFSNEDGGTSTRALMARWGRTTDVEYVYKAALNPDGSLQRATIQGRGHQEIEFDGRRVDCLSEGLLIEPETWVRCVDVKASRVLVRPIDKPPDLNELGNIAYD